MARSSLSDSVQLGDRWTLHIDNQFPLNVALTIQGHNLPHPGGRLQLDRLCVSCQSRQLWKVGFSFTVSVKSLEAQAARKACDMCCLLWKACSKAGGTNFQTSTFTRVGSGLTLNSGNVHVLSICQEPSEYSATTAKRSHLSSPPTFCDVVNIKLTISVVHRAVDYFSDIQIGYPCLQKAGSDVHFKIMNQWLDLCDSTHYHMGDAASTKPDLPTRLIDVGHPDNESVRLRETQAGDYIRYIALSHPWGDLPHFCTYRSNLKAHMESIKVSDLPATFRDAVVSTRALGLQYLWIDPICIIQGPDGDFISEAKRMEQVFSSAYCALAASCTIGQSDGFLKPRRPRDYVQLPSQENNRPPLYLCDQIDDFNSHVLQEPPSTRGWVLQEHALARRTIFFTEHQTYFECGKGVHCETMIRMSK